MLRQLTLGLAVSAAITVAGGGVALAAANPSGTGQPSQTCQLLPPGSTPGNAASAPGSAFNSDGHAGTVYAGTQPQNSR